jgi:hypothetical protein
MSWNPGDAVVRREIVVGKPWLGWMVNVVEDNPDLLVTYSPEGSAFSFPAGAWPTPDGRHPWHEYSGWFGHGALMMQRPGDGYAVWHFWDGPERTFRGWYVNLEVFARTEIGFDAQDLELDIMINPDGTWEFKDIDLLLQRHDEGRFAPTEVRHILELGKGVGAMIETGKWWWRDRPWLEWRPDPEWDVPPLPEGWDEVPSAL